MAEHAVIPQPPQPSTNDTECLICGKAFSRLEHLKRHITTHTQEKPYSCRWCKKGFARKDAAQRHESSHFPEGSQSSNDDRTTVRSSCAECTQARIECSGLEPCQRCTNSGLKCGYPARKKRRRVSEGAEEQAGPAPGILSEHIAPEALAPERQSHLTRSPLSSINAGSDHHISPSQSTSSTHLGTWTSQPLNTAASSNTSLGLGTASYPDEALISAIMDAPGRWEGAGTTYVEHVETGLNDLAAGRRYFMPTGDTTLGGLASDINWLPLDCISEVYFDSISANSLNSTVPLPVVPSQVPHAAVIRPDIQPPLSAQHSSILGQSTTEASLSSEVGKTAGPSSQQVEHANLDEIENVNFPRRKHSLYVDGGGSRRARAERSQPRRTSSATPSMPPFHNSLGSPNIPNNSLYQILDDQVRQIRSHKRIQISITDHTYKEIIFKLENVFSWFSPTLHPFTSGRFPSIETIDWFVRLYFENFNPVYPFLDKSLLSVPSWGCCITLAAAAIGANYMSSPDGAECSDALHGLLHEILTHEYDLHEAEESLVYVQARALNIIGLCNSYQKRLMDLGYKSVNVVSAACSRLGLLDEIPQANQSESEDQEHAWITWRVRESRRRTGLFVWMLDCSLAYISNSSPHFSRTSLKLRLPSTEDVWEASSSQVWKTTKQRYLEPETFQKALQVLYVERRLKPHLSEFGSMILIHGLIHQTWDVARSFEDSLSLWTPSATTNNQTSSQLEQTVRYLPTIPEFSRWRNSACDCLDALHWEAHGISARAGGLEGPKYLILHLARTVLLAPVKELEGLVGALSSRSRSSQLPNSRLPFQQSQDECYKIVRTWAERDKYKARLAVVHAAATFWHVRRYSADSFVQPFAVFLATLVLWAYSAHSLRRQKPEQHSAEPLGTENSLPVTINNNNAAVDGREGGPAIEGRNDTTVVNKSNELPSSDSRPPSPSMPEFMHLDRPFDDEIGQHFIRHGDRMTAFVEGVGDLCSKDGPRLTLLEGARILRNRCATWTIAENYAAVLDAAAMNLQSRT